jgi:hypothetical protein
MIFCSQCAYLLTPEMSKCPRCGTPVQEIAAGEELDPDSPTIISRGRFSLEGAGGQTSDAGTPAQETPSYPQASLSSEIYNTPTVIPTQHQQDSPFYPGPQSSAPGYAPEYQNANYAPRSSYQGTLYPTSPASLTREASRRKPAASGKGGYWAFLRVILFAVAGVIGYITIISPGKLFGGQGNQGGQGSQGESTTIATVAISPTSPPATSEATQTAEQQARNVIQQYYANINAKNYQAAYDLWVNPSQSYEDFAKGFEHTQRDDIILAETTLQSDGTIKVNLTITATEETASGTQQRGYQGYYVVGQQADITWKIVTAHLSVS